MTVSEISDKILDEGFGIVIQHSEEDDSPLLNNETESRNLLHYGVKGMKWGVRKEYEPHPRKKTKTLNNPKWKNEKLRWEKIQGSRKSSNSKRKIDKKKLARNIAIGIGAATIAGLTIYAAKKYIDSGKGNTLDILQDIGKDSLNADDKVTSGAAAVDAIVDDKAAVDKGIKENVIKPDSAVLDKTKNEELPKFIATSSLDVVKEKSPIKFATPDAKIAYLNEWAEKMKASRENIFDRKLWNESLSEEERTSLEKYMGPAYSIMNYSLRTKATDVHEKVKANIDNVTSALSKSITHVPIVTTRRIESEGFANMLGLKESDLSDPNALKNLIGSEFLDRGFYSSSYGVRGSDRFFGIDIHTYVPSGSQGMYLAPVSDYPEENEFLIQRNTSFKINDVIIDSKGMVTDIMVEIIGQNPKDQP